MRLFRNMKLSVKLPLIMILLAFVTLAASGYTAFREADKALLDEAGIRLDTLVESRKSSLKALYAGVNSDLITLTQSTMARRAMVEFDTAWSQLPGNEGDEAIRLYVSTNRNPAGQRHLLDDAGDLSSYSAAHKQYHPSLTSVVVQNGLYDAFLIDLEGNIIYSVFKESDFGDNLFTGPLRDTGLADVARRALLMKKDDEPALSDISRYGPSADAPAQFAAAPVYSEENRLVGVVALQIPVGLLDAIMQHPTGLGETGETFFYGPDFVLRTNLIHADAPTSLNLKIETENTRGALSGDDVPLVTVGVDGSLIATAVSNFTVGGITYGITARQSMEEVSAPAWQLGKDLIRNSAVIMLVVALIGWFVARSVSRPLTQVGASMGKVSARDYTSAISCVERGDEIGFIGQSLEKFRDALAEAEVAAQDGAFKGAAFGGSSAALMMFDKTFTVTYVNGALTQLMAATVDMFRLTNPGFDPNKIVGRGLEAFLPKPEQVRAILNEPSNLPHNMEIKVGESRFTLDMNSVSMPGIGSIGYVMEWKDVTAARMNEAVLSAMDRNQSTAEFDVKGRLVAANTNFTDMLGLSLEGLKGKMHDQIMRYNAKLTKDHGPIWERLMKGESIYGRFWMTGADDREVIIDGGFTPVMDNSGVAIKVVMMGSDVTEAQLSLRTAEAERKSMAEAQALVVDSLRVGLASLSEGDLTVSIDTVFAAEYEELRRDFNAAAHHLAEAISAVIDNAVSIQSEAGEIANAADDLSKRTEKQAATLEQTAAALDELTSSVQSAATGAGEANKVVTEARASAEASGIVVREAVTAMGEISASSDKISKIISVIDDIAFQTNLLALNAGVEAARAGEAGRGFAVVASEVRALAQRSSEAAREISELISTSSGHVKRGVDLVGQTGDVLRKIVISVTDISARVSEISASAQEQSAGLAEINIAVNQLDQVTQQNAAMFEQTTAASHSLTREAEALSATTAKFRVAGKGIKAAAANAPSVGLSSRRSAPARSAPASRGGAAAAPAREAATEDWEDF